MHLEGGVIVGGLLGVLEATALVDGHVDEHRALLHLLYGLLPHQLRRGGTRNKDGTDDEIGLLQFLIDGGWIGDQGAHATGVLVIEALEDVRIEVQHRHLGAQTVGHCNSGRADLAAADNYDACRLGARNTGDQQAAAALSGQQVVGAFDGSKAASYLGHRGEKRQGAVAVSDRLIGDGGGFGVDKCLSQRTIRRKVQVGEDGEVWAQVLVLSLERLLHLQQQLCLCPGIFGSANDAGTRGLVLGVREGSAFTGTSLNEDLMAILNEGLYAARGKSHAILVIHDFFWHSNTHYIVSL